MQAWPLTGRTEELKIIAGALCPDEPYTGVVIAGWASPKRSSIR